MTVCGFTFDPVLDQEISIAIAASTPITSDRFWSYVYIIVICF